METITIEREPQDQFYLAYKYETTFPELRKDRAALFRTIESTFLKTKIPIKSTDIYLFFLGFDFTKPFNVAIGYNVSYDDYIKKESLEKLGKDFIKYVVPQGEFVVSTIKGPLKRVEKGWEAVAKVFDEDKTMKRGGNYGYNYNQYVKHIGEGTINEDDFVTRIVTRVAIRT
mmetsp:Transcript_2919/g.4240  ORF Transcript_2919/g.4240 Transcript_2919/m.4240 type:complete len:172 (-) Transcript_2919:434-949(-)